VASALASWAHGLVNKPACWYSMARRNTEPSGKHVSPLVKPLKISHAKQLKTDVLVWRCAFWRLQRFIYTSDRVWSFKVQTVILDPKLTYSEFLLKIDLTWDSHPNPMKEPELSIGQKIYILYVQFLTTFSIIFWQFRNFRIACIVSRMHKPKVGVIEPKW